MNKKSKKKVNYRRTFFPKIPTYNNIMYYNSLVKLLLAVILAILIFIGFHFVTFNHHKTRIKTVTKYKDKIAENVVFLGDSITKLYDLDKYYLDTKKVNSGISGNVSKDILDNMYERVYRYNPSKIFLLIGTNQLENDDEDKIFNEIINIVDDIHKNNPITLIYVESIYPVNNNIENSPSIGRDNKKIKNINKKLKDNCKNHNYIYIDIFKKLEDPNGNLTSEYTEDGLHLNDDGYKIVTDIIKRYL